MLKDAGLEGVVPWVVFNKNLVNRNPGGLNFKREQYFCSRYSQHSGKYEKIIMFLTSEDPLGLKEAKSALNARKYYQGILEEVGVWVNPSSSR